MLHRGDGNGTQYHVINTMPDLRSGLPYRNLAWDGVAQLVGH